MDIQALISYLVIQVGPYMTSENIALLLGQVMPFIISIINKYIPDNSKYRSAVSWGISGLIGLLTVLVAGKFDAGHLIPSILAAYGSSQVAYRFWFKGSDVEKRIQK